MKPPPPRVVALRGWVRHAPAAVCQAAGAEASKGEETKRVLSDR